MENGEEGLSLAPVSKLLWTRKESLASHLTYVLIGSLSTRTGDDNARETIKLYAEDKRST